MLCNYLFNIVSLYAMSSCTLKEKIDIKSFRIYKSMKKL